jgi:hypothetical protein
MVLDPTIHIFSHTVVMQMSAKETDRLIKQSKILMRFMSGEEKTQYLTRMWDLYFDVYIKKDWRQSTLSPRKKHPPMKEKKAYELLTSLVKIFGH